MRTAALVSCAFICALLAGCTASSEDVRPPADKIYFPTGIAVAPDDSVLFVANANSELRYDSGSISVINLEAVKNVLTDASGGAPAGCAFDLDHRETLNCGAGMFLKPEAAVRIGNFATDIAVQQLDTTKPDGPSRLFVPTRGDPSVSWADYDGARLSCTEDDETFALCDDAHRLTSVRNNADQPIPDEPFGVFVDSRSRFAAVTHLSFGAVSLISSPEDPAGVQVKDVIVGLFQPDTSTGLMTATGIAGRPASLPMSTPGAEVPAQDLIYVASSTDVRVQTLTAGTLGGEPEYWLYGNYFWLDVGSNTRNSIDTRGLKFSPSGDRLYLVNRVPPTLQVIDTSIPKTPDSTGVPRNATLGASDICRAASTLAVLGEGAEERVYVTCFQDGQVYIVNPFGTTQVEDILTVGRGPYGIAASTKYKKLFVTNFLEDTIAVIDVDPQSPQRNRVVLRIGEPRTP